MCMCVCMYIYISDQFSSVQFSHSVVSDSLQPHESQHARPPSPSPTPGVHPNSCPLSWWHHPAISSSVVPFSIYNVYNYICNITRCICVCVLSLSLSLSLSLYIYIYIYIHIYIYISDQISRSVVSDSLRPHESQQPGLPVHHQLAEFTETQVHQVSDAIQPSHPLSSPSPPAPNPSQHQGLFQWVNSLHEVAKVLEFQL